MGDRSSQARKLQQAWVEAQRLRVSVTTPTPTPSQSGLVFPSRFSGSSEQPAFTPPLSSGPGSPSPSYSFATSSSRQSSLTPSDSYPSLTQSGKQSAVTPSDSYPSMAQSSRQSSVNPIAEMYHDSVVNFREQPEQPWQSATNAYIRQWLQDELLESHHASVTDLLAFQVIHNDLADMIGEEGSRLEVTTPPTRTPIALAARPAPVTSKLLPLAEDWMSSLLSSSSLPQTPGPSRVEFPVAGRQVVAEGATLQEVTDVLLECGAALARQNAATATDLVDRARRVASPHGTPIQRLAYYFVQALIAKLNGTAAELFTAIKRDKPSVLDSTLAFKAFLSTDPTLALAHHFGNSVLLDAFEGAERVHIIDYGIQNGHQWPSLMQALAYRLGGPPRLRITGIELPQPGLNHDAMVKETGRRLAKSAADLGIVFEYKAFSNRWEDVQIKALELREDEVLAVSSVFRLRHLLDDSVVLSNPRRTVLERICRMEPKVLITGVVSLAANAPFLMTRLQEAIPYCFSYFDSFEATIPRDSPNRSILERELLGREILNMIACEGKDRRERPEAYYQWHWRLVNAGFQILPVKEERFRSTRNILKNYHDDWTIGQDEGWILSGWKGRIQHGYAAWKPAAKP